MAKCKYCGFDAPRNSDEDCPDNPDNKKGLNIGTHTPGEWEVCGTTIFVLNNQRVQSNRLRITQEPGWTDEAGVRPSQEELEANARLIKLAPEILKALKELAKQEDWEGEDVSPDSPVGKAWKLISKVEGRKLHE